MSEATLRVRDLKVSIENSNGTVFPVDGVSFAVRPGRTLALVGESGSGKSLSCLSILGGLPIGGNVVGGDVKLGNDSLLGKSNRELNQVRGRKVGVVLQDPTTSLNPLLTVGDQIAEMFVHHEGVRDKKVLAAKVIAAMRAVQIPSPELRLKQYPHQFSGGMRQRIAIAMAIACRPALLIADEPTTALDATIRLQILALLRDLQRKSGMAILFVTHDLNLVRHFCDDVAVMYAGRIVESGTVGEVFSHPTHPYSAALIDATPRLISRDGRLNSIEGQPPRWDDLPAGCRFAPRCKFADDRCKASYPPAASRGQSIVACWKPITPRLFAVAS